MKIFQWNKARINEVSAIQKYEDNLFQNILKIAEEESLNLDIHRIKRGTSKILDSMIFSWIFRYKGSYNIHATYTTLAPIVYLKKVRRFIITVHDLIPLVYPMVPRDISEKIQWKLTPKALQSNHVDHLIAISEFTKKEIIRLLKIEESKISVIHQGVDHEIYKPLPKESCRDYFGLEKNKKYILYVASNAYYKRVDIAKKVFEYIRKYRDDVMLIKAGYSEKIKGDGIISMGWIDEKDMPKLYNSADVYIHTSEYEGFGLPILEAMACGIPVVTLNRASIPEVVGNAGTLIDLNDKVVETFAEAVLKILDRESKVSEKSLERSKLFSWENTAKETLKVYENVFMKN